MRALKDFDTDAIRAELRRRGDLTQDGHAAERTVDLCGPDLAYTNDRARNLEANLEGFARAYNNDLHALLTWARELVEHIEALEAELDTKDSLIESLRTKLAAKDAANVRLTDTLAEARNT